MMKCSVFIATSVDGYIAREDGAIDWLEQANMGVPEDKDFGYFALMDSIDFLVMGSHTYEKVLSFGEWPYSKPVIVLTHRELVVPENIQHLVTLTSASPVELCQGLEADGFKHIYVDGGSVIQSFLRDGLITDFSITTIPVLLGGGIPLFGKLDQDVHLELVDSTGYDFGFVQSNYRVL